MCEWSLAARMSPARLSSATVFAAPTGQAAAPVSGTEISGDSGSTEAKPRRQSLILISSWQHGCTQGEHGWQLESRSGIGRTHLVRAYAAKRELRYRIQRQLKQFTVFVHTLSTFRGSSFQMFRRSAQGTYDSPVRGRDHHASPMTFSRRCLASEAMVV
jgi:hypothetical protein